MKIYKNVRSTAEYVPSIEVNLDTVYVRNNIKRIEEMEFSGWEYDEVQYNKDNYIENLALQQDLNEVAEFAVITTIDKDEIAEMLVYALSRIDELEGMING